MRKQDLATRLARRTRTSKAAAADRLDRLIHDILFELKKGNPVALPGLGTFTPGRTVAFEFEKGKSEDGVRRGKKR
jgi:nucleoid DNA-binding protein